MTEDEQEVIVERVIGLLRIAKVPLGVAITICASVIATLIAIAANDADDALAGTEALVSDMLRCARERAGKAERPN